MLDQPNTIGALPIAVARDCGCTVAYLPGLAMRKAADLYQGKSTTDARDAFIIAETARAMPHTLRAVDRDSEVLAALKVLSGFDADLTHECTRAINRLRSLLLQILPALERVFPGTVLTRSLVLELFIKYAGPTGLRAAGRSNVLRWARNHSRKDPVNLVDAILAALGEQTVTVIGTEAVELVIPRVAAQIKELKHQRAIVAEEVEKLLDDAPRYAVNPPHDQGTNNSRTPSSDPPGSPTATTPRRRPSTKRKRAQGKKHNAAVICLARRRCDVIHSMLRHGTIDEEKPALAA